MEQQTETWLKWRQKGIGSSDAPIIMGVSPWGTRYSLWEEKTGRGKPKDTNWAMQRGNDLEPKARATYELMADLDMPAELIVHPKFDFIRASLDGFNKEKGRILEIKCPSKADHVLAVKGEIPEKYIPQVQHQLLATGEPEMVLDYFSFHSDVGVIVTVRPDAEYLKHLMEAEVAFWETVIQDKAPELTDADYHEDKDPELKKLIAEWKAAKVVKEEVESKFEKVRSEILARIGHPRVRVEDVRIQQITKKGNVDYAKIPQLKGLDLEQFRKKPNTYFDIRLKKAE